MRLGERLEGGRTKSLVNESIGWIKTNQRKEGKAKRKGGRAEKQKSGGGAVGKREGIWREASGEARLNSHVANIEVEGREGKGRGK